MAVVDRAQLRAALIPLLEPLSPDERVAFRAEIEAAQQVEAAWNPASGEDRAVLRNLGPGYTALDTADLKIVQRLVETGVGLLAGGSLGGLAGKLLGVVFAIRRHGVPVSDVQGRILRELSELDGPVPTSELGTLLATRGLGLPDQELVKELTEVAELLAAGDTQAELLRTDEGWSTKGL